MGFRELKCDVPAAATEDMGRPCSRSTGPPLVYGETLLKFAVRQTANEGGAARADGNLDLMRSDTSHDWQGHVHVVTSEASHSV